MTSRRAVSGAEQPRLSRRERFRQATIDEIKQTARAQMAAEGPASLSLRAVARAMGITPSALYRYFEGMDDLITALCVDAYNALGDAVADAVDAAPTGEPITRWFAYCQGMRRWALEHPADFALIYGTPLPGYHAPEEATRPAGARFTSVALQLLAESIASGALDLDHALIQYTPKVNPGLQALLDATGVLTDRRSLAILLGVWTIMQGHLTLELFGHLNWLETDHDAVFDEHVRTMLRTMGFDRAAVATTPAHPSATTPT
jgi:AcrR family transcriptional regulator